MILISHFGLSEGMLNSGMSIISDIGLKDLRGKYELVLLGHYHKPQEIIYILNLAYYKILFTLNLAKFIPIILLLTPNIVTV